MLAFGGERKLMEAVCTPGKGSSLQLIDQLHPCWITIDLQLIRSFFQVVYLLSAGDAASGSMR